MGSSALAHEAKAAQIRLALALIWITPAFWAVNYIVARKAPGVVDPHVLALGRWAIAGALLGFAARAELWRERAHLRQAWWQYLVLGAFGMVVCGAWVYLGARTTVAMNIALIFACAPILIVVGAALWLGESMRRVQVLGVALALAGVAHVVLKGQWSALGGLRLVPGDAWIALATVAWAAFSLLQKMWPSPLGATARLAAMSAGGVVLLLPFAAWELTGPQALSWSWQASLLVLAAAIIPGVGAYWIHGWSQRVLGASRVAMTLYLSPLYAALASWAVLSESLGLHHLAGAAFIFSGVLMVTRSR